MPAVRAYSDPEIIACGLALEATGSVTRINLHQALGGRGDRNTAFNVWTQFAEHRDRLGGGPVDRERDDLSPAVAKAYAEACAKILDATRLAATEQDAVHDRRAGHNLAAMDALLARNDELGAETSALQSEIDRLTAALAATPSGGKLGRLILP